MNDADKSWASCAGFAACRMSLMPVPAALLLAFLYVVAIIALTFFLVPSDSNPHYQAARDLGANTRLTDVDLAPPSRLSTGERLLLAGERRALVGKYLRSDTKKGDTLDGASVATSPELGDVAATPVAFAAEPDLKMYNHGTDAELAVGDENRRATIIAVITSGGKWYALFPTQALGEISGKEIKIERVLSLPRQPPAAPPPAQNEPRTK